MSTKTLTMTGAVLVLLCFATPGLQAVAAETIAMEPFSLTKVPLGESVTLRTALERVLQLSPELLVYKEESRAREAEISQASRMINPELSIEVANVVGSGSYSDFDAAETTLQLSQQFELGGKRQLRREVAEVEHYRSVHDLASARIDVQANMARFFWVVLGMQDHLRLADEQIALATQTLSAVEEKIAAGKAPAVEKYRFQSALAEARLDKERATLTWTMARQTLANHIGLEAPALSGVIGDLTILPRLPGYTEIEAQLGQNPEVVRRQMESEARRRALALVRAHRIVDPTIGLGLRNFKDSDDNALTFGLSLPLPLFDRNQGNVQAAVSRLAVAQAQEVNGLLQSRSGLAERWQSLAASLAEEQALREQILPSAQQTFDAASYGYQSGKFSVLEMLDAQRSLIEVRERYLEVLIAAHLAAVELDRMLGRTPLQASDQLTKE